MGQEGGFDLDGYLPADGVNRGKGIRLVAAAYA